MPKSVDYTRSIIKNAPLQKLELLDYSKGLNTFTNNDVVPRDQLVYITDSRISTFGVTKTRRGLDYYSDAAGETQGTTQTSSTGAAEQAVTVTTWYAIKYVASTTGRLTKFQINMRNAGTGRSAVLVDLYSDNGGVLGDSIAKSSFAAADFTSSLAYMSCRFIEAPQIASGTTYWVVIRIQDDGSGQYNVNSTTAGATTLISTDSGVNWSATSYDLQFKAFTSTDSPALGLFRAYKSDGTKKTLMPHGTSLYTINDATGALTAIKTGLNSAATKYRFETANDTVYYVNGKDAPRKWDFTTEAAASGSPATASNLILHKNQMFYADVSDPAKIYWSDIASFETFTSTNFLYVPAPKSADPMTGWKVLNDNLFIFTAQTKWVLYGSDSSNFVLRRSTGLKGAPSQEAIASTRNHIYFLSDDGVYQFDGATDKIISTQITDQIRLITSSSNAHLKVWSNKLYLFFTPTGAGQNQKCLVYNINYESWESIDLNTYISISTPFSSTQDNYEFAQASSLVGQVFYAEKTSNTYNNLGRPLDWEIRTRYEHYDNPASQKRVKRWYPRFTAQSSAYPVNCYYDKNFANAPTLVSAGQVNLQGIGETYGGGATYGTSYTYGIVALVKPRLSLSGKAQYIQERYLRTGVNNPVEFLGHTFYYQVRRAR